jgi:hypothetical protein
VSRRIGRAGVVVCVGVIVALSVVYSIRAIDLLADTAHANAAENYDDREFAGGNSLVVDKRALYNLRALVPEDGTFRVVAGPGVEGATELTEPYIDQFARSFLMPRRPDPSAEWILCYGCDRDALDSPVEVVWDGGNGITILKVTA